MATSPPEWDNLPPSCRILPNWVLWRYEERRNKKDEIEITKAPIDRYGKHASSTAPHTWCHLDEARKAFESGIGDGIGFVFTRAAGITGVDLDHCRDSSTGEIDAWAQAYIDRLNSYPEISPSGEGVHILVKGTLPEGVNGRKHEFKGEGYRPRAAIEMYSEGRFFTCTGSHLQNYPRGIEGRQEELIAIFTEVFGQGKPDPAQARNKAQGEAKGTSPGKESAKILPDEAVIARMLGSINANEIEALLRGDKSAYSDDDSAADIALCNHLAFWTAKNRQQMDRIFRTSKLMRPKWDEKRGRQTYGERTIDKACRETKEVYQPDEEIISSVDEIALSENVRKWDDKLPPGVPGVDKDGVAYYRTEKTNKKDEKVYLKTRICDGYAYISEETRDENEEASFTVEGRGSKDGHEFKFDITGRDFSDSRKLKAALVAHFGARNQIKDLDGDIIQSLTRNVKKLTLVTAPSWINDKLAIPGIDENGFKFRLSSRIPADLSTGEKKMGLDALDLIFKTWPPERSALLIGTSLASPVCGRWFCDDRFGLALVGTTGRGMKTAGLMHAMAIYGAGFLSEKSLLRWGEGSTVKAALAIIALCGCLPSNLDNYKNTQRDGAGKFVSVVHTALEGRERERLNRENQLRETKEFASTLLVTAEDLPEEASTVARLQPCEWSTPPNTDNLNKLQKISHHLPAVGRLWCRYLSDDAQVDMDEWRENRSQLVKVAEEAGAVNPGRIGTTAAILKLVWTMALDSPLGQVLQDYTADFEKGLSALILNTSTATRGATEGAQFVEILKELISSGRCIVLNKVYTGQELTLPNVIGWRLDDKGQTAIFPGLAIDAVRRVAGPQAQMIGQNTLFRQLDEARLIEPGKDNRTQVKRAGAKTVRVLVFKAGALQDDGILEHVDLTKSAEYAAEDIERQKRAADITNQVEQAVKIR